jgi:isocitrate/isopropylmalate dehydrogenase
MMLEHLGEQEAAANLKQAIGGAFKDGVVPIDLGGDANTAMMVEAVISRLK